MPDLAVAIALMWRVATESGTVRIVCRDQVDDAAAEADPSQGFVHRGRLYGQKGALHHCMKAA